MGLEQRRHDRYRIELPVILTRGKRSEAAKTVDVSLSGVFLAIDDPPPLRELVKIDICSPDGGKRIHVMGMAVHVVRPTPDGSRKGGVGVQLFGLDPETTKEWTVFINRAKQHARKVSTPARPKPAQPPPEKKRRVELRITGASVDQLREGMARCAKDGSIRVHTDLHLDLESRVSLVLQHPTESRSFTFEGWVVDRVQEAKFRGVRVLLLDYAAKHNEFEQFLQEEFHVTVDVGIESLVPDGSDADAA